MALKKYDLIKTYLDSEGKFERMPGKRQKNKQKLMFEYLSEQFEADIKYTESEVNEILNLHHSFNDPASLRRFLCGAGWLDRTIDGRAYWLKSQAKLSIPA